MKVGKGVWNRQGQVTLRVANPVVVSTLLRFQGSWDDESFCHPLALPASDPDVSRNLVYQDYPMDPDIRFLVGVKKSGESAYG